MTASGLAHYFMGDGQEAYYFDDIRQPGRWFGRAVAKLGLQPTVTRPVFHHLLRGYSPDGQQPLVQNAGHPKRDAAWDLTFSAPKSVSVLWALAPEPIRKQIEQAHRVAVAKALAYVEDVAGLTRRGKGGVITEHADLVFATFFHGASRAQDPAIHTHAVLVNLGLRQDGTTGALRTLEIFRTKMAAGEFYRRVLAEKLTEDLQLCLLPERVGFHVRGVPKDLCVVFSQRSRALRKVMQERGLDGAVAAKMATLLTRPKKEHLSQQEFFARCHEVAREFGWGIQEAQHFLEHGPSENSSTETQKTHGHRPEDGRTQPKFAGRESAEPDRRHTHARADEQEQRGSQHHQSASEQTAGAQGQRRSQRGQATSEDTTQQESRNHAHSERAQANSERTSQEEARGQRRWRPHGGTSEEGPHENARHQQQAQAKTGFPPEPPPPNYRFRMEWRRLFPKAPFWSLAQFIQAPVLAFPDAQPRWGGVLWKRDLRIAEFRVQWRRLFPDAPKWSLLQGFKLPALRLARPAWAVPDPPQPKWWTMHWKADVGFGEFRLQNRHPFRYAPKWSPLRKVQIPALRLTRRKSEWTRLKHHYYQHQQQQQRMHQSH